MNNPSNKSKKVLSVFSLVMINVIAIDSLRNLPANAETGYTLIIYYLVASIIFLLPYLLITAELATNHPKTGGSYVWVREAFGPLWGFINIWLQWIYNVFWYPTILSFIAVNIAYLFEPSLANNKWFILPIIIGMFSLSTIANYYGMKVSSLVSTVSAIGGTLLPIFFIICLGVVWIIKGDSITMPFTSHTVFTNIFSVNNMPFLVIVFFSLMGFEMSAVHAGDVKNPKRDYPKALIISSIIIMISTILASIAIAIVVPKSSLSILSGLDQAYALFFAKFGLKDILPVIVLLIILGAFGGISAWVIGPTKGLMVAAEDKCFPASYGKRNRYGAPSKILWLQLFVVILLCVAYALFKQISTWYWILSDLTAQIALIFYMIMFLAAVRLRYKNPNKKPGSYHIPGGKLGIWCVALLGTLACLGAIVLGFLPPTGVAIKSTFIYDLSLVAGIVVVTVIPFLIYRHSQK